MFRPTLCLFLLATCGCVIVEPRVTNPLPNVTRVAVVPFANHSVEPAVDTVLVTNAYYAELQKTPGFEVVPISITAKAIEGFGLRMASPRDALELARVLDVDAVVVGAVTDFDPYDPPRIGWHVEWYSPHSPEFARGVPVDPSLRPDVPPLPEGDSDACEPVSEGGPDSPHCEPGPQYDVRAPATGRHEPNRTAGRSNRWDLGIDRSVRVRGQSPDTVADAGFSDDVDGGGVENAILAPVDVRGEESRAVDPWTSDGDVGGTRPDRKLGMREPEPLFPDDLPNLKAIDPPYPFERLPESPPEADDLPTTEALVDEPGDESRPLFEPPDVEPQQTNPPKDVQEPPSPALPPPPDPMPRFVPLDPPTTPPTLPAPTPAVQVPVAPVVPFDVAAVRRSMSLPFDSQRPIMAYTRVFDAKDQDLLARLRDYYELNGDERAGGWRGYLQRSDDFVRFTAHVAIVEMLTLHGGETRRRYVWKFRTRS